MKLPKIKLQIIFPILTFCLAALFLLLFTKGDNFSQKFSSANFSDTKLEGPFELSNTSSRYALTEAIVQNNTFALTKDQAKFAAPDVVSYKNKFMSIFTPGVAIIGVPLYIVGEKLGYAQIFTFFTITIVALLNIYLISRVSQKMGASLYAGLLSGLIFEFATNALGYTFTFTQHQISTALILILLLNALGKRNLLTNILFGLVYGVAVIVDIPNAILAFPILMYVGFKHISFQAIKEKVKVSLKLISIAMVLGISPLIIFFAWYNFQTTGSYTKIAQNIGRTAEIIDGETVQNQIPKAEEENKVNGFPFQTRNMINGLYTLGISDERSWIYYSPIVLFGLLGFYLIYKRSKNSSVLSLCFSVILLDFVLYSMFGDPWGGWAFGPRYLIPAAALMSAGIGVAAQKYSKNIIFAALFLPVLIYSVYVNVLGALTTNAIPPKTEALALARRIPYTYLYNQFLVEENKSGNLLYNAVLKNSLSLSLYLYIFVGAIALFLVATYLLVFFKKGEKYVQ